ncbi:MAG: hypothetical protein A2Z88_03025 [Omnitrophica WOR_2 bacterium GWA2_47_8]|nr:MAG: hypothetical protein A2Z88_03025 [Omnitrophica WOR_2 bacterium GWA2_47_8]
MLDHNKKFTFRFKDTKIVFNKLAHETEFHLFAKALVYALYHKDYRTLRAEVKLDEARFQPDLSAESYDGKMVFWAEVGKVSIDKVEKLFKKYRQAHFVFVKEERDVALFKQQLEKRFKDAVRLPLVDIIVYPEKFQEWNVSEDGDVFIKKEDVTIIRWHEPEDLEKFY